MKGRVEPLETEGMAGETQVARQAIGAAVLISDRNERTDWTVAGEEVSTDGGTQEPEKENGGNGGGAVTEGSNYLEMDVEGPSTGGQPCVNMSGQPHAENRPPGSSKEEGVTRVEEEENLQYEAEENEGDSKHNPQCTKKMRIERSRDRNKERTRRATSKTSCL
jgi:hypothetical protein